MPARRDALEIGPAGSPAEARAAARLMMALVESNRNRYPEDRHLLDEYYRGAWFMAHEPSVPDAYRPPEGEVLVACLDDRVVGTVSLCRVDAARCELKFMFVSPEKRGSGIAEALCHRAFEAAGNLGYARMRLVTGDRQPEARALYAKLGFRAVEPWDPDSPAMVDYLEKAL